MLVISFRENLSKDIGGRIDGTEHISIESSLSGINSALAEISHAKPGCVIALGMYSGKDRDKLRLETQCSSRFRNTGNNNKTSINNWLSSSEFRVASGLGNSWCNKLCWEVTNKFADLPLSFVHAPKGFDVDEAAKIINAAAEKSTKSA